jgi:hypothetical protein
VIFVIELPETIRQQLIEAGWRPGRRVTVADSVPADHPARDVLAAFGGLIVLEREPEPDWPPIAELVFRELPPSRDVTDLWGPLLGTRLFGIAGVHNAHGELFIASDGRCFGSSNIHPAFYYYGASFAEAIEGILLGRRARPMLLPGQQTVTLYGEQFTADSPEVYRYR